MYFDASIHELGSRALAVTEALHPEDYRTYVVDRNINYANWCTARCIFCNFKADPPGMNSGRTDLPDGYTLSYKQIGEKIEELVAIGGTQILMQGGLAPKDGPVGLSFEWYLDLMRFIKRDYPGVHIHAFSPPEIFAFHQNFDMSIYDVLARLMEAGLDSVPGGGGEILADRVRRRIGQGKTLTGEWLEVMRQCHVLGMKTSCTMMFGHMETLDERFEHLRLLRELQDESLARGNGGGFSAYICWTFQPADTPLGRMKKTPKRSRRAGSETPKSADGVLDCSTQHATRNSQLESPTCATASSSADACATASSSTDACATASSSADACATASSSADSCATASSSADSCATASSSADYEENARFKSQISNLKSENPPLVTRYSELATGNWLLETGNSHRPVNDGEHLLLADAHEYLTMLALSRSYLDNIPNIQSSWVTMGPKIGQLALFYGANDMGSVMMEENVVSAAGTTYRLNENEIRRLITDAGWRPQKRNHYYEPIG